MFINAAPFGVSFGVNGVRYYILYRNERNIVACDSFQGIKNRQPHIRLPAIAIIVNAINQNLPGAPAAKSAFG